MKKTAVVLLAAVMLILCSCNGNPDTSEQKTTEPVTTTMSTTMPPKKAEHIAQKIEEGLVGDLNEYSEDEKEQIKDAAEKDGYTLEFKDDGSGVLSNEEGEWTVGAGWVENDYTASVPEMDFGVITMSVEESDSKGEYYMFLIRQADFFETENYVETLEQVGFNEVETKAVYQQSNSIVFIAENKSGKRVEIGYSPNGFTLKLYK